MQIAACAPARSVMYALLLLAAAWTRHDDPLVVMASHISPAHHSVRILLATE